MFNTKGIGQYNNVYYINDIMQLIDIEENFTSNIRARFKLDSSSLVDLPSLSWEAAIKRTRMELELLTDHTFL